jgi:4-hydroxy-tetrahydrodipicolinate reductase
METVICGRGPLGRAIERHFAERGDPVRSVGRPGPDGHEPSTFAEAAVVIDASTAGSVAANVEAALADGCRRFVIATTGWDHDRDRVAGAVTGYGAVAVIAPNLSLGAAAFFRLVGSAAAWLSRTDAFEPYVVEWHRRGKRDRPSGTAAELVRRIGDHATASDDDRPEVASIRAGWFPGTHLVGFDAIGETIELRLTARDRTAYAAGARAARDWLIRAPRHAGLHPFDIVVEELLGTEQLGISA